MKRFLRLWASVGVLCALFAHMHGTARATEGGGGVYPNGAESFLTAVVPPPGYYFINYVNYYEAQKLVGSSGNSLIPDFRVDAFVDAPRFVHWGKGRVFGAEIGQQAILPYVVLDVRAAGAYRHKSGIGDLTVDPLLLSWQNSRFHFVVSPEFNLPTGSYTKGDLANIGRNYLNFEPVVAVSYTGVKNFELSSKLMYDINATNPSTNYRSGQELHLDYAVGYKKGATFAGLAGYFYTQTTDDRVNGIRVGPDGFRGRVFAAGPEVNFLVGGAFFAVKWEHEMDVKNRTQGDKFWIKLVKHIGND